ncbi:polyamine aminopropyltransferase [Metallumcola ferriviriculae]|uniref:Polyamine aminopropyltransferase n=1 Tax=Metallumcola ferriviriculae TaxID=3039180 RepID=A0AAU0UN53_9FIRM|nr:polyamine aminopropyltransferase [Desulfitibacteraceae bacterium MK1]
MKGLWFTERQNPGLEISCLTKKTLHWEKTDYQELAVIDTETFGRMLLLDGVIQTTIEDEFVYHEMISMVALNTHPNPEKVLVIGGGDGGTIREIAKHPKVKEAVLVEIDGQVVETAKKYLPEISVGLDNPKVRVIIDDGIKHVQDNENTYDVIIVDSTDPVGPAVGLFSGEFYRQIHKALTPDGIFVAQTESPFFNKDLIKGIQKDLADIFAINKLILANVPTYPGGLWTFSLGSKKYDPEKVERESIAELDTKYYSRDVHFSALVLPPFVKELMP